MTKGLVTCGTCGSEMIREYPDGKKKLRTSILVWEGDRCIGKCRKCGADVVLPVQLSMPAAAPKKKLVHIVFPR